MLDHTFWDGVARRAGRQAVQVLIPVLVAMAAGSAGGYTLRGTLLAVATAVAFTIVTCLAGIATDPTDAWWIQALERAVKAAAGAFAAYFVAGPASDLLTLPWHAIGWATLGAAGLAVVAMFTNPPAITTVNLTPVPVHADRRYNEDLDGPRE